MRDAGVVYVDGHLDLATVSLTRRRDLTRSIAALRAEDDDPRSCAMVSLPELSAAGAVLVGATLWAMPKALDIGFGAAMRDFGDMRPYATPEEAKAAGLQQLALYEDWERRGLARIVRSRADLHDHLGRWRDDRIPGLVICAEGADIIRDPADLDDWWARGLRVIGLAWGRTRYAGGTGAPGGLTTAGCELLEAMREKGAILDVAHLAEEAFWQTMEMRHHAVVSSHGVARRLTPGDTHADDAMLARLAEHDAIIGVMFYNRYLDPRWSEEGATRVTLAEQVARHVRHIAGLVGWSRVGLGTDLDAGGGPLFAPAEVDTCRDIAQLAAALPEASREDFLSRNWLRFYERALPA